VTSGRKHKSREDMKKRVTVLPLGVMHSALCLLGVMLLIVSFPAEAQQLKKVPRIGILSPGSGSREIDAFRQSLRELGYVEGQNIAFEHRWTQENENRLLSFAADELLHLNVDIVVTTSVRATIAARRLTKETPIVATVIPGPYGLVESLGQPGGNVTGLSFMRPELGGKRLELLKEVIPGLSRVAVLSNVSNIDERQIKEIEPVAQSLGVQLQILNVKKPEEIENAFSLMTRGKAGAITVLTQRMLVLNRKKIVELAARSRRPAIYPSRQYVEAGGLMSYGPNQADLYRRAAIYVDKILKGANPADLPVEQPIKFEFVINLKAAEEIGLRIPSEVLMWADRVIK
jgi:putative ABC transport system substrate-binding protein